MMGEGEPITIEEGEGRVSRMKINPLGARIENLTLNGREVLDSVTRGDGKKASTHPCSPIFGAERESSFDLPQHGPVRGEQTTVWEHSPSSLVLIHEIKAGNYPLGMMIRQRFTLQQGLFTLETQHTNRGTYLAPVNFAEHFYWITPKGWEGLIINGQDVTDVVKKDSIISLKARNQIAIPGLSEIILEQTGLPYANLWAYYNEDSGEYDQHYVCIEPVEGDPNQDFFGSRKSFIHPGDSRGTTIRIQAVQTS